MKRLSQQWITGMVIAACLGCSRAPSLVEYPSRTQMPWNGSVVSVPVIVVGVVKQSSLMGTAHKSRWNDNDMVQLVRLDVTFENVIKGDMFRGMVTSSSIEA